MARRKTASEREKFLAIEEALNVEVLERHEEIRGLLLAVLSRKHIYLFGEPGLAKSFMLLRLTKRIANSEDILFKHQMSKTTNDSELFGPFSLSKLKEDRFERITTGKLPEAHFAYIDETLKASGSILDTMLSIMEERTFENGEQKSSVPLITMMGASNEFPSSDLAAFADRFHLRFWVQPLRERSSLARMMVAEVDPNPETLMTLDDIEEAQRQVEAITVPDEVLEMILQIKDELFLENINISDRRLKQSLSIARAEAWLNGHSEVEVTDIRPLQHMFWREVAEIPKVRESVLSLVDPLEIRISQTLQAYQLAYAQYQRDFTETDDTYRQSRLSVEIFQKWKAARQEFDIFKSEQESAGRILPSLGSLGKALRETIPIIIEEGLDNKLNDFDLSLDDLSS